MNFRTILKIIFPLLILVVAMFVAARLITDRPQPEPVAREVPAVLVETMTAIREDKTVIVRATGTVQAAREATIVPQVAGRVVWVAEEFTAGGFFSQDDLMLTLEEDDYRLVLERSEADVVRAEVELTKVEGAGRVARQEWERFGPDLGDGAPPPGQEPNPLVLYEPQLRQAQAAVRAARAARDQARLNLDRTKISAPFNCRIRSENAALGQFVPSGSPVAVVADTDSAEIRLPVRVEDLDWLRVPGARAVIRMPDRPEQVWHGQVVRSLGEVDPHTRMATLVISVADPYGLERTEDLLVSENAPQSHLTPGLFVEVDLEGVELPGVVVIPRRALREQSTIWLAENGALRIRSVSVIRAQGEELFVLAGVEPGQRIILTSLTGVGEGMAVRTTDEPRQ
ncbi:RND family efflux transporter, MFP subunit [Desulfonatronum thiosulfatophilum]|uniref:RND family efflux transporter, MFP subunit n=1 Tax=Desulfonatronum thiosulfatophilum TaxID=617002 RepID=A0A1G6DPT1_9BACT|nr:HlyD family efflux transporter periplasmic adaptor subunit [Desulfonatronum thiosulfatophilum]SDB47149.1 RND family efflux transporter, MFP subunit [Desulfonatronum thiosulfatophilum]